MNIYTGRLQSSLSKFASYRWQQACDPNGDFAILFYPDPSVVFQIVEEIVRENAVIYLQCDLALDRSSSCDALAIVNVAG